VLCFALFLLICLKILYTLRCGHWSYAFVCGDNGTSHYLVLPCSVFLYLTF
jgi:hypothetical protein